MGNPVAVVGDSTHYLPEELIVGGALTQVSLYTIADGNSRRELDVTDYAEFYGRLKNSNVDLPTTSQPSVGDFVAAYEPLLEAGNDIVSVHLSAAISGTTNSATQAAQHLLGDSYAERVTVVDSRAAAGAYGLPLLAAMNAAKRGEDAAQVAETTAKAINSIKGHFLFAVDSLDFLRRGGRIGAAQAWIGGALQIKPILTCDREIVAVARVRTSKKAFGLLLELAEQLKQQGSTAYCIQHVQAHSEAARLASEAEKIVGVPPAFVSEVGPVIGTHVGPGLLGLGGIDGSLI